MISRHWLLSCIVGLILSACNALPQPVAPTSTRHFSAPTLQPSPEVVIRSSDELYDDSNAGQSNPTAASLPVGAALPPLQSGTIGETGAQPVQIFLEDGTPVAGDLYEQAGVDNRAAGILIIGQDVQAWGSFPSQVFDAGYTVLVLDLPDILRANDLDVMLTSLSENGTVDPGRIATIGAEAAADMALMGCAVYEICDAVALLSPQSRGTILNVLPNYLPRPLFVAASINDSVSYDTARAIAATLDQRSRFVEQSTGSGTGLLTLNSELSSQIINWLGTVWSG